MTGSHGPVLFPAPGRLELVAVQTMTGASLADHAACMDRAMFFKILVCLLRWLLDWWGTAA